MQRKILVDRKVQIYGRKQIAQATQDLRVI